MLLGKQIKKLLPREAASNLLAIITYQTKRILQPGAGRGVAVFFVAVRNHKKENRLL